MNEIFITIIIFITIGFLGILNLSSLNNKFILEKETRHIFDELSLLNLNISKNNNCLKYNNGIIEIFDKNTLKTFKKSSINQKVELSITKSPICCNEALVCTPSSITLSLNEYFCKITISLRGQIKKICNKE